MLDETAAFGTPAACIASPAQRWAHIEYALSLGLPEVATTAPRQKGHVAVVATGPSVRDEIDTLWNWKGPIWAVNGALDMLLHQGIAPHAWVSVDPLTDILDYLTLTPASVHYYPASVCHPKVLDRLIDLPHVKLWHPMSDLPLPPDMMQIGGGSTSATRAPLLAYALGYRRVTLFGVDSSWEDDGTFQADGRGVPLTGRPDDQPILVQTDQRTYRTSKALLNQATYIGYLKQRFPGKLHVAGRGLAVDLVRDLKGAH